MKKSKPCLPRKMKKAMLGLEVRPYGKIQYNFRFRLRHYPRTKWVVRAERQFRRKIRELEIMDARLEAAREALAATKRISGL